MAFFSDFSRELFQGLMDPSSFFSSLKQTVKHMHPQLFARLGDHIPHGMWGT
jgi:hypothetical protein